MIGKAASVVEFDRVPILDVAALYGNDKNAQDALADDFLVAYGETGFAYIVNHGIDEALVEGIFEASARFHALPRELKLAIELNDIHRGFIPINTSTDVNSKLADVTKPNQSESFMVMREDAEDAPDVLSGTYLAGPNQWPEIEGFQADVMAYHDALASLGRRLMSIAVKSVGVDSTVIETAFEQPTTWLRLLYYPPTDPMGDADLYGSAPHTDFGCLTILAQDEVGGLQVQTPAGDWVDVPRMPGAFVVNVGDMLHRWSNGRLLSTPHRVINRSGKTRYSCPFFFDPNVGTDIEPFPECIGLEGSLFESVNFGSFLKAELEAGYQKHKRT